MASRMSVTPGLSHGRSGGVPCDTWQATCNHAHVPSDDPRHDVDQLALAIGRVAMNSAELDDSLRRVLSDLAGENDTTWIIFEGQGTEWLINNIKVILNFKSHPDHLCDGLREVLGTIKTRRNDRNWVVHGTWLTRPVSDHPDDFRARPWGALDDEPVWFCLRSQYGTFGTAAMWTVSDINLLAEKLADVRKDLLRAYGRIHHHRFPELVERYGPWTPLRYE